MTQETTLSDQEILALAMQVVADQFVGSMATVDFDGRPHVRYMGGSPVADGLNKLYTLTGRKTRKIKQLERNPAVSWLFSREGYEEIVTLHGKARVLSAPVVSQQVWDRLADSARRYVMNVLSNPENVEFVTIETEVESVEYLCPSRGLVAPRVIPMGAAAA